MPKPFSKYDAVREARKKQKRYLIDAVAYAGLIAERLEQFEVQCYDTHVRLTVRRRYVDVYYDKVDWFNFTAFPVKVRTCGPYEHTLREIVNFLNE